MSQTIAIKQTNPQTLSMRSHLMLTTMTTAVDKAHILTRLWSHWDPQTPLGRALSGTTATEKSLGVSLKGEYRNIIVFLLHVR